ncbi:hypothetical protein B296_00036256 [Ensete ventricosum]|uniref:Uncharacterized protein n=1 Tax=Ensete ventricosum TaxID=4639 RepID=A0A426YTD9_ENSVE|nr:hypothetical protein B296_00036256 [Ensete ventricosum]
MTGARGNNSDIAVLRYAILVAWVVTPVTAMVDGITQLRMWLLRLLSFPMEKRKQGQRDVMGAGVGGREEAGERDVVIICRCQRTVVEVGLGGRATKALRLHRQRATATAKEGDGNAEQRKKGCASEAIATRGRSEAPRPLQ